MTYVNSKDFREIKFPGDPASNQSADEAERDRRQAPTVRISHDGPPDRTADTCHNQQNDQTLKAQFHRPANITWLSDKQKPALPSYKSRRLPNRSKACQTKLTPAMSISAGTDITRFAMARSLTRFERTIDLLTDYYGAQEPQPSADPIELILWENIGYLISDERRRQAFDALRQKIGTRAEAILAAKPEDLYDVAKLGGMLPEVRVDRLLSIARITVDEFGGHLDQVVQRPLAEAKKAMKMFPSIGDPGARKGPPPLQIPSCHGVGVERPQGTCKAWIWQGAKELFCYLPFSSDSNKRAIQARL
jgi:hypothetical protein